MFRVVLPPIIRSAYINKLCDIASCWIYEYIGILLGVRPILHISRLKVNVSASNISMRVGYLARKFPHSVRRVQPKRENESCPQHVWRLRPAFLLQFICPLIYGTEKDTKLKTLQQLFITPHCISRQPRNSFSRRLI
jgi:hypothetical protein